jgi:preprotein translocase subunit SecE
VARNRKRAKERRSRRPAASARTTPGRATAGGELSDASPDPIEHGTPDVELAEAQLALGRPELAGRPDGGLGPAQAGGPAELGEPEEETYFDAQAVKPAAQPDGGGELAAPSAGTPERRANPGARLVNFVQGSWRELQRVQWPDRRAVMQATGVVIGFVIVAGLYLGLADQVASKIVTLILK